MVGVHTSCAEFNKDALPNFSKWDCGGSGPGSACPEDTDAEAGLITNETKEYAETAIEQLTGLGDGSFQGMLDILTSDRYKEEGSENSEEFQGASKAASGILLDLSKQAQKKADRISTLVKQITSVSHSTSLASLAILSAIAQGMLATY